jgi:hypothetical protein
MLVPRLQQGQDVVASAVEGAWRRRPISSKHRIDPRDGLLEPGPGAPRPRGVRPGQPQQQEQQGAGRRQVQGQLQRPPDLLEACRLLDPEHHAQDHLQGDRLHARAKSHGDADRPALQLPARDLGDPRAVLVQPLPVEGREQQSPVAEVRGPIQQQDRVAPHDRLQDPIALAGQEQVGVLVKTVLMAAGSVSKTRSRRARRRVKGVAASAQTHSMNWVGRITQRSVCTKTGRRGPGEASWRPCVLPRLGPATTGEKR